VIGMDLGTAAVQMIRTAVRKLGVTGTLSMVALGVFVHIEYVQWSDTNIDKTVKQHFSAVVNETVDARVASQMEEKSKHFQDDINAINKKLDTILVDVGELRGYLKAIEKQQVSIHKS
jgi:uncharacterized protein YoxC